MAALPMTIRTCHRWIEQLATQSSAIAAMQLDLRIKNADLDTDAFNLANDPAHTDLIVRAVQSLLTTQASSAQDASTLLTDIICRDAYGKFAELAAYDWLGAPPFLRTAASPVSMSSVSGRP
jgi:hypothetical protein